MPLKDIFQRPPVPRTTHRRANTIANGAFLVCLGILFATDAWWPGILLALWITLVIRQYLSGRIYDLCISSAIFLSLFAISFFKWNWSFLMPVLFVVGGLYIIFREYFFGEDTNGEDKAQEMIDDLDDKRKE